MKIKLKIIPKYTGCETLEEAIKNRQAKELLWLEILLNDGINWQKKAPKAQFKKARIWFTHFKTLITGLTHRRALKPISGKLDYRDHRKFLEGLYFAAA
ncbi:hypothetical protein A2625_07535 [candidate division WOR-1 bacterium RIFCSPHIGHO2_01_FULL_53_15]|uniref:Uncharacterized protein n=1 Tax=candidate division WOR-1 bacterium RIFCSPHIGHO2_01_FULL_53_15 TaxID=1802564 RepID=A0A1F4Q4L7_UNCSA|nr:MAG: hypothetical protein A2625_07535 [candidate division WOR-1 bacterium RIFCSPHIGHO2_01_FULL_53_15]OGC10575.1 MAG: hypothetical protein A3D23_01630 [candidate division WOR-1 bacterium RIFCSPHIGHO2_02_FULL_53_26]